MAAAEAADAGRPRPLRIAAWANLPSGGGLRALHDHLRGLVERGHHVQLWSPPTADLSLIEDVPLAARHVVGVPGWDLAEKLPAAARRPLRLRGLKQHARDVARQMALMSPDVVFASTCMFQASPPLARFTGLPSVLYLQEPFRPLYEAMPVNLWALEGGGAEAVPLKRRLAGAAEVQMLRLKVREEILNAKAFSTVLCNSRFSAESIARAYGITPRVCYLGVDTEAWSTPATGPRRGVLGIGSFHPHKRVDMAIEAMALLGPAAPPLTWVGNMADEGYLAMCRSKAAQAGVDFRPLLRLGHGDVVALMAGAAIFCCTARLEPFGYGPLEAGAAGLPVVAVAEGGLRETVSHGHNGLLVEPTARAVAEGLRRLVDDPGLAEHLGREGRRRVALHWSLGTALDNLEGALYTTVGRRPATATATATATSTAKAKATGITRLSA